MNGLYATNGRHTECPCFTRLTYRTRQQYGRWTEHQELTKHRPKTTQWVQLEGVDNILDLLSWEEDELKAIPAQQVFTLDDHGQGSYLMTNQTKQICGLITYMKHVFRDYNSGIEVRTDPFHPFLPEE